MTVIALALVLVGAALLVAEAHMAAGVLGAAGGALLAVGVALAISAGGGGLGVVLAVGLGVAAVAGLWVAIVARTALPAHTARLRSGRETLSGQTGEVRSWNGSGGQVFVDGALWRAQRSIADEEGPLEVGDRVVVERVDGLTLTVRKAEEWEVTWYSPSS